MTQKKRGGSFLKKINAWLFGIYVHVFIGTKRRACLLPRTPPSIAVMPRDDKLFSGVS